MKARSAREQAGLEIAATVKLRTSGVLWLVPSQSSDRTYTVNPAQGTCSCTDYGTRKVKCKHLWAVEFTMIREGKNSQKATPAIYDASAFASHVLREIDADQARQGTPF